MEEFLPKSEWGPGAWQDEPDHFSFEHKGMPCILHRAIVTGSWCGYVAVSPSHPFHGIHYGGCTKGCRKEKRNYISRKSIGKAKRQGDERKVAMLVSMRNLEKSKFSKRMKKENPRPSCRYNQNHSPESLLDVHGGLTYADYCQGPICHVPKPGESDNVWWFGFDCAHAGDLSPAMKAKMKQVNAFIVSVPELSHLKFPEIPSLLEDYEKYRDMEYAKRETENLADQLLALEGKK